MAAVEAWAGHRLGQGIGGRPDLIHRYLELGASYVSTGNDISFLIGAAAQKRQQFN